MVDLANGAASLTTMVSTWQRVAADAAALGIRVANLSYEGSAPVYWPEQKAMDAAAHVADLAVAVMGGNGGASTHYSHGALNVLAVGAVVRDTHVLTDFSSRGPLEESPDRFYPDLVANGQQLAMPQADNESVDRVASGTSYGAPQAAGAMALYRSVRPAATSLETRAAAAATAEIVGEQNRAAATHGRNGYGLGYLRTDRLLVLALDPATTAGTFVLTPQQPTRRVRHQVAAGGWYVAAAAWNRQDANNLDWSNLNVTVSMNGVTLGRAATPQNVHERVIFRAPASGMVDVDVAAVRFETGQAAVACGFVVATGQRGYREGEATVFGRSCRATIDGITVPSLGTSYATEVLAAGATSGALWFGASDRTWNGVPLPLPLAAFGMPLCDVNVSPDLAVGFTLQSGFARLTFPVPADSRLLGATYFHQAVVTPSVNPLGVGLTAGLRLRIAGYEP
jgi:hypothetical protein